MKKTLLVLILIFISFYYGLLVGTKKVFPYDELVTINSLIKNKSYKPEIVMFGDSITNAAFFHKLSDDFKILNKGINGLQSNELLYIIENYDLKVQKAFVMIGINDFLNHKSSDEVFINYMKIIEVLKRKNIKIYVQSTLYVDKNIHELINKKVKKLNEKLQNYSKNENIAFIDLNKYLAAKGYLEDQFTTDGIHLNKKAYEIWYNLIEEFL